MLRVLERVPRRFMGRSIFNRQEVFHADPLARLTALNENHSLANSKAFLDVTIAALNTKDPGQRKVASQTLLLISALATNRQIQKEATRLSNPLSGRV